MTTQFVQVIFKIYDLPTLIVDALEEDSGLRVGLVGSIPELGLWKTTSMQVAESCGDDGWSVTCRLPASTSCTWTWVVTALDARVLYLDPAGKKRANLGRYSGVLETTWGLEETSFISETSAVRMRIHFNCEVDQILAVVGSGVALGSWDPQNAVRARKCPGNSSDWVVDVLLDTAVESYQWKWVVLDKETGSVTRWEESPDRYLVPRPTGLMMIDTKWNSDSLHQHWGSNPELNRIVDVQMGARRSTDSNIVDHWLNNANCLELPFEVNNDELTQMDAAERAVEPTWLSVTRRLPAVLSLAYNIYSWAGF